MATLFNGKKYPLIEIILDRAFFLNEKMKDKYVQHMLYYECLEVLKVILPNKNDIKFFDFKLKYDKFADEIKIVPLNILTALWFIDIFPKNSKEVLRKKEYVSYHNTYKFNNKTKILEIL